MLTEAKIVLKYNSAKSYCFVAILRSPYTQYKAKRKLYKRVVSVDATGILKNRFSNIEKKVVHKILAPLLFAFSRKNRRLKSSLIKSKSCSWRRKGFSKLEIEQHMQLCIVKDCQHFTRRKMNMQRMNCLNQIRNRYRDGKTE